MPKMEIHTCYNSQKVTAAQTHINTHKPTKPILKYSPVFIVLGVKCTKCQRMNPDIASAAQQMFTFLFTYLLEPI